MNSFAWYPERLTAAIYRAYAESLKVAGADAEAHSGSSKAGARAVQTGATTGSLVPTGPIGAIQEKGAGPHTIAGRGVLRLANGDFVTGPVQHPGRPAKPYIRPAAQRWASGGFQGVAKANLAGSGFR
jgi:hypothetical protein